jgi:hypothetical protein
VLINNGCARSPAALSNVGEQLPASLNLAGSPRSSVQPPARQDLDRAVLRRHRQFVPRVPIPDEIAHRHRLHPRGRGDRLPLSVFVIRENHAAGGIAIAPVQDVESIARDEDQVGRAVLVQSPQCHEGGGGRQRVCQRRLCQDSLLRFIHQQRRPILTDDPDDHIRPTIRLSLLPGRHCREPTRQGHGPGLVESLASVPGNQIEHPAPPGRRDDVQISIPVEITRRQKLGRFRRLQHGRIGEKRIRIAAIGDALDGLRSCRRKRFGIPEVQRHEAASRNGIPADQIGEPVEIEVVRGQRQRSCVSPFQRCDVSRARQPRGGVPRSHITPVVKTDAGMGAVRGVQGDA